MRRISSSSLRLAAAASAGGSAPVSSLGLPLRNGSVRLIAYAHKEVQLCYRCCPLYDAFTIISHIERNREIPAAELAAMPVRPSFRRALHWASWTQQAGIILAWIIGVIHAGGLTVVIAFCERGVLVFLYIKAISVKPGKDVVSYLSPLAGIAPARGSISRYMNFCCR